MRHSPRLLLAAILIVSAAACRKDKAKPEEQARRAVEAAVRAVRDKDLQAVASFVSEQYTDKESNDRRQVLGLVRAQVVTRPNLYVFTKFSSVDCPTPTQANVVLHAGMASVPSGSAPNPADLSADVYRFELVVVDEDGTWRLRSAGWAPAGVKDLL
jgi:hypothetical protein